MLWSDTHSTGLNSISILLYNNITGHHSMYNLCTSTGCVLFCDYINNEFPLPPFLSLQKSFTLILQALDVYNTSYPGKCHSNPVFRLPPGHDVIPDHSSHFVSPFAVEDQLIEEASFSGVILPSNEWHTLDHKGKNARITYRWAIYNQTLPWPDSDRYQLDSP